jgi:uncharacterized protein YdhG (YjbR/CyaY superfamily)
MAEKKRVVKTARKPAKRNPRESKGFTAEERAAMRERARELEAEAGKIEGERAVLDAIAAMPAHDRALATQVHTIVKANAPTLVPRLWYGMPAYARNGDVVCFFQSASKFKTRYCTLGFSDKASLDDGTMWPTAFALMELTAADETRIGVLLTTAVR